MIIPYYAKEAQVIVFLYKIPFVYFDEQTLTLNFKEKIARTRVDLPILLPWQTPPTFMWTHFGQF